MPLGEGSVLSRRYRLLSQIGRGGMGTVWRAHDDLLDRDVAVKEVLFPPGLSDDENKVMYERTLREARSAARLNHPGIVTVHDVVEEEGRPCIVMEFVRSRSLQDLIDEDGRLPAIQVAEIGGKVLAALRTAHAAGITHRDVKPANVLLAGDPGDPITRVVITDFGIATMEGDSTLTQTGLIMGSPAYIAPERARGEPTSPASDLWSLGATLYAAVEGTSPHHRPEAMAALTSIISEDAPPPRYAGPLAPVLMGLLVKDPAQRLTAEQAAEGLTQAAHSTRPLPAPSTTAGDDEGPDSGQDREGAGPSAVGPRPPYELSAAGPRPPYEPSVAGPRPPYEPSAAEPRSPYEQSAAERRPYEQSAALAEPGSRAYGPATRHLDTSGGGHADPTGPVPAPRAPGGASNVAEASPSESWVHGHDHPTEGVAQGGAKRSNARTVVLALVAVLVVGGAVVAWMLHVKSSGSRGSSGGPISSPTSPQASSPSTTPSPTVPAGFKPVTTQDGAKLAVPKGFQHERNRAQSERWIDPKTGDLVQVDTIAWGTQDPVKHWQIWDGPNVLPGYQSVNPPHGLTARGWKAGDVEYSWLSPWKGGRQRVYVLDRGFTANGRQYAIMAAARDRATAADDFKKAFTSFQPGPPGSGN
ncbi:hypothetical protein GCM10029978_019610 [Actinoallomurus acanthiterrae]